jgi:hypothetical protein
MGWQCRGGRVFSSGGRADPSACRFAGSGARQCPFSGACRRCGPQRMGAGASSGFVGFGAVSSLAAFFSSSVRTFCSPARSFVLRNPLHPTKNPRPHQLSQAHRQFPLVLEMTPSSGTRLQGGSCSFSGTSAGVGDSCTLASASSLV